jgi:NAD(P)-dependent dehydrogenase (short-subunit alcohol dehydrogenase family)
MWRFHPRATPVGDGRSMSNSVLKDRTAVITGAASGMGRATAIAASEQGAHVVCFDLSDSQPTIEDILERGGSASMVVGDVRDPQAWREVNRVAGAAVYLLANVAGIVAMEGDTIVEQTKQRWDRIIGVDLEGVWCGMKSVLPGMIEHGEGRIVNVASIAGTHGLPQLAAYTAAKAGVLGLTRQAAVDYARHGIRVNAVAPGVIDTAMNDDVPAGLQAASLALTPVGRAGRPEEIAATILFLASPLADYITGQVIAVDGGRSICGRAEI